MEGENFFKSFLPPIIMKNFIIPIFIPHLGCRHQCIFCNQKKITGHAAGEVTPQFVKETIDRTIGGITQKRRIEAAFYGGSFTALPLNTQKRLLKPAYEALISGKIDAIRLSTRPDAIDSKIIQNLLDFKVETVELGVQSLDDKVLKNATRGHNSQDVIKASRLIKKGGLSLGLQLMPGLPGEDWESLISTTLKARNLYPDLIRIYPAVVIAGTALADLYSKGLYRPLSIDEAIAKSAYIKLIFQRAGIPVIRLGLQATEELNQEATIVIGPYHPAFGEMVDSYLFYLMIAHFLEQEQFVCPTEELIIRHHPKDSSKVRGIKSENLKKLKNNYGVQKISLLADSFKINQLTIEYKYRKHILTPDLINLI